MNAVFRFAFLAAAALTAACTVHGVDVPPLTGPSDHALALTVTASPDSIQQDGASQSAVVITAIGPDGRPLGGQSLRLQTSVDGVLQDFGLLSARTVVTSADGRATAVYTAPPPSASLGGGGNLVTINVTPIGGNYQTAMSRSASIRLVPVGVVLPPASAPISRFSVSPTPVNAGVTTYFDATASCASQSTCGTTAGITGYVWNFGDGSSGSGQTATHVFATEGTYTVSLTVTNDRGLSATTTQAVTVNTSALPTAAFVVTPANPRVGTVLNFNADTSTAAPGRRLVQYSWNFGDGTPGATGSFLTQHTYTAAGTYTVVLAVLDDAGQKATATVQVSVLP